MDYDDANKIIGAKLRGLRAERGITRDKLTEMTGIPGITIRRVEGGKRAVPVPVLLLWVRALRGNAADFLDAAQDAIDEASALPEINEG